MSSPKVERDRVLSLLADGQITVQQASQLLDTIAFATPFVGRERIVRVQTTGLRSMSSESKGFSGKLSVAIPLSLLEKSLQLASYLLPQLERSEVGELLTSLHFVAMGRVFDLQDLERGERLEIFLE